MLKERDLKNYILFIYYPSHKLPIAHAREKAQAKDRMTVTLLRCASLALFMLKLLVYMGDECLRVHRFATNQAIIGIS